MRIPTQRRLADSRHVSHRPDLGGYDLGVLVDGEDEMPSVARHPCGRRLSETVTATPVGQR